VASSGGESRILRVGYGPQVTYSRWALRSIASWREFLERAGGRNLFLPTGVLWIGPERDAYLRSTIKTLHELGVRFEALRGRELRSRYPQFRVEPDMFGIYERDSGAVLARAAVQLLVEAAVQAGVVYRRVQALPPQVEGRVESIKVSGGESIRAERFVFACGPWLPKLFPDAVGRSIRATRQEVFFFSSTPGAKNYDPTAMPSWVDFSEERIFYGCPNIAGRGFKVAADKHGREIDPDTEDRIPTAEGLASIRRYLQARFPELSASPCIESRVCQYENTKSGDFLIDRLPKTANVWIVGGGSGHGFKHGPAVGEYVLSLMDGGKPDPRFSLPAAQAHAGREVH